MRLWRSAHYGGRTARGPGDAPARRRSERSAHAGRNRAEQWESASASSTPSRGPPREAGDDVRRGSQDAARPTRRPDEVTREGTRAGPGRGGGRPASGVVGRLGTWHDSQASSRLPAQRRSGAGWPPSLSPASEAPHNATDYIGPVGPLPMTRSSHTLRIVRSGSCSYSSLNHPMGLPQLWLTSSLTREGQGGCPDAQEVPTRVQARRRHGRPPS